MINLRAKSASNDSYFIFISFNNFDYNRLSTLFYYFYQVIKFLLNSMKQKYFLYVQIFFVILISGLPMLQNDNSK